MVLKFGWVLELVGELNKIKIRRFGYCFSRFEVGIGYLWFLISFLGDIYGLKIYVD